MINRSVLVVFLFDATTISTLVVVNVLISGINLVYIPVFLSRVHAWETVSPLVPRTPRPPALIGRSSTDCVGNRQMGMGWLMLLN